jgi:hypothetical protein
MMRGMLTLATLDLKQAKTLGPEGLGNRDWGGQTIPAPPPPEPVAGARL